MQCRHQPGRSLTGSGRKLRPMLACVLWRSFSLERCCWRSPLDVQVPFWPVKMSMQSFMVLALAATYGSRLGTATVVAYLLEGAIGLPVFQSGGSLASFGGPTAGYLTGFVIATWMSDPERAWSHALGALCLRVLLLGDAIIMVLGTAWLSTLIGFEKAAVGRLPDLPSCRSPQDRPRDSADACH